MCVSPLFPIPNGSCWLAHLATSRVCPIRPVIIPDVSSQPHRSDDQHNDGGEDYLFARAILQLSIIGSWCF